MDVDLYSTLEDEQIVNLDVLALAALESPGVLKSRGFV